MTRPELRDRHKGRKCYIFGSGPSLARFDCDKLAADGVTIFCNASIMAVAHCDYWLFCDPDCLRERAYCDTVFDKAETVLAGCQEIYDLCLRTFGPELCRRVEVPSTRRRALSASYSFAQEADTLVAGGCVEVALHLACVMGCSPIILVGVDLKWDGDQKYFHDRSDAERWPRKANEGSGDADPLLNDAFLVFKNIHADNPGLPVCIANPASRLCQFWPWIDLSEFHKELSATEDRKDVNG